MTCDAAKDLVESYLDDELEVSVGAQVREHLATCGSCAEAHRRNLELRGDIRTQAPYYQAPAHLRGRIGAALRKADRQAGMPWRWMALAASLLLAVSLTWNVVQLRSRDSAAAVPQNILADHIRSLMGAHLVDVPSSDQHTVKPWFNGKLDFSPDVKDFAAQGFPLLGGRLDYADGRAVAALVYQRRRHVINLFTWPSVSVARDVEVTRNGYHALRWNSAGMTYWAVSDLGIGELRQFATLYTQP